MSMDRLFVHDYGSVSKETWRIAALAVCSRANNADDARELLKAIGFLDDE